MSNTEPIKHQILEILQEFSGEKQLLLEGEEPQRYTFSLDGLLAACENLQALFKAGAVPGNSGEAEAIIKFIEQAEIGIPIEKFFNEDKTHITKGKYGELLILELCEMLRAKFLSPLPADKTHTESPEEQDELFNEIGAIAHGTDNFSFYDNVMQQLKQSFTITRKQQTTIDNLFNEK